MDSFDLAEQRIVQLEQIPSDIRVQIERGDGVEYALDLSLNRLRTIDQIGVFEHVCQLDLSGNQLETVNGVQALRRLQSLDLSRNCISSVDLLALVPTLRVVKVAENSLTSIDSLQLLPELRVVDASYNRITKWPTLAGLSLLETLDLSDNMLDAFHPSISSTLFPPQLRRLSIARNQVDKLCGIASLGVHLPVLEFFAFDGNPVVFHVSRSGGQLERLLATIFFCVPLSNDGGLTISSRTRDEFLTPPQSLNCFKRAVLEGREADVEAFLITGSVIDQRIPPVEEGRNTIPPPPAPHYQLPARHQNQIEVSGDPRKALDNTLALSHQGKLEIWKRIREDRKTNFSQSSGPSLSDMHSTSHPSEKSSQIDQRAAVASIQDDVRDAALTTADLGLPDQSIFVPVMSALDTCSLSGPNLVEPALAVSSISTKDLPPQDDADNEALMKKIKTLTEQVVTMRKYMKMWIKREKMVRESSARKIQRWARRLQREYRLKQRVLLARKRRSLKYGFRHCSSTLIHNEKRKSVTEKAKIEATNAQRIQSQARGFIVRQRIPPFKKIQAAAIKIQKAWRKTMASRQDVLMCSWKFPPRNRGQSQSKKCHSYIRWHALLRGVLRCSSDVKQLQQVCAMQDEAISHLWQCGFDHSSDKTGLASANLDKKIILFQGLWRGYFVRKENAHESIKQVGNKNSDSSIVNEMKRQLERQASEIDQLKQQLQVLQSVVAGLTQASVENAT